MSRQGTKEVPSRICPIAKNSLELSLTLAANRGQPTDGPPMQIGRMGHGGQLAEQEECQSADEGVA